MAQTAWRADDFQGLTPAIDLRRTDKLFAMSGENYIFNSLGPLSAFGDRKLLPQPLGRPEHVQGCRLKLRSGDRTFTFEGNTILEWREDLGGWKVIYVTANTTVSPYRWTYGYLNGKMYFCHPRTGLLVYDLSHDVCTRLVGAGVPSNPLAMCINNGRLVVIDDVYLSWSWQSDGSNFAPALGQAGFQQISDRVSGFPVMVTSYGKGVFVWTTGGLMRSEFTGDEAVYRHRNINTEYRMINSFCWFQNDENTVVILDERGLFKSQGEAPQPFAPLFNEFLIGYIAKNKLKLGQNVRLEWDDLQRLLYVSVSLSKTDPIYEKAYVYYPSLDKWGSFNQPHYGILPITIPDSTREGDYFGFVDSESALRIWRQTGSREAAAPSAVGLDLRYPLIQKPTFTPEGTSSPTVSSSMVFNSFNEILYTQPAALYPRDGMTPEAAALQPLDAKIRLGLIRIDGLNESNDQLTEMIQIMLGNVLSGEVDELSVDFELIADGIESEEYLELINDPDFYEDPLNYINHKINLISSVDGSSEFMSAVPDLVQFNKANRYYACSTVGIWHILEIEANEVGEMFHIRAFEMTGVYAGRLV